MRDIEQIYNAIRQRIIDRENGFPRTEGHSMSNDILIDVQLRQQGIIDGLRFALDEINEDYHEFMSKKEESV